MQLPSCFIKECNKVSITSTCCSALACASAEDNGRKMVVRLTWWKTKVPAIVLNFFSGFIGDSIMSTPCTLVFGNTHIIEHKSISWDLSLILKDETSHLFHVCQKRAPCFMHICKLWYYYTNSRLLCELGLSKGLQFEIFLCYYMCARIVPTYWVCWLCWLC